MRVDGGHDASSLLAPAAGHRIGYERQGCSRAIDVVLHRGRPAYPDRPTTSPFSLTGNPPPHAAIRARVGMPAKSDGSPWIKLKKSCVETPNRAVYALFCAISMVGIEAPSIRLKALRLPPSSRIATFSLTRSEEHTSELQSRRDLVCRLLLE